MEINSVDISILRTKLHRPPISSDHIHRTRLLERLNKNRYRPFTLISAPAGYGKSTLVSFWLELCELPSAWVSLYEYDNNLHLFLSYFVQAVQNIFPGTVHDTQAMLKTPDLPPVTVLSRSLTFWRDRGPVWDSGIRREKSRGETDDGSLWYRCLQNSKK
jgi:LuxR family maltose regulon positive regulatory protein